MAAGWQEHWLKTGLVEVEPADNFPDQEGFQTYPGLERISEYREKSAEDDARRTITFSRLVTHRKQAEEFLQDGITAMDQQGFRTYLQSRQVPEDRLDVALALAERFEAYLAQPGKDYDTQSAWDFSRVLIAEGLKGEENYITLIRYGCFIKNDDVFVAMLELVDGGEAHENLYRRVSELHGEIRRDQIFAGIGVAPYGTPTPDKPATMQAVIERLEEAIGAEACRALLADSLRDLPDEYATARREKYLACKDLDAYLVIRKQDVDAQLEACQRDAQLIFSQKITAEVLDFVCSQPEMGGGVREGEVIYETKIPSMTEQYLAETDDTLKRYYSCHCPWAREAVKVRGKVRPIFCNCSAGDHKRPWQGLFGQKLEVEVLENVRQGDERCHFAIHLPEGIL
ncbi:MAG: hypothetical protein JXB85_15010 [Anaerolineales bacterium]|nr:hypothetical protein [Anaerolineales bacterium]